MPKRIDIISNPFLDEFTFHVYINATTQQKMSLNGKYLEPLKSSVKAKTFVRNLSIEDRAILLTKLGVPFAWVFGELTSPFLKELFRKYKTENQVVASNFLFEQNVFVVTHKEIMTILSLAANNVHSETWMLNRDYLTIPEDLKDWKRITASKSDEEIKTALEGMRGIAKFMFNQSVAMETVMTAYGITHTSMMVLLYLLSKNGLYIPFDTIKNVLLPAFGASKITMSIKKLMELKFIARSHTSKKVELQITALGIDIAMKFQKKVFNMTY